MEEEKKQVLLVRPPQLRGAATPLVPDGAIVRLWEESVEGSDPAENCAAKKVTHRPSPCGCTWQGPSVAAWSHISLHGA